MHDGLAPFRRAAHGVRIGDVARHQLDAFGKARAHARGAGQETQLVPALREGAGHALAQETRTPGEEDLQTRTVRDVYEVDGSVIRDREGRLAKLFLKQSSTTLEQARQIAQESSRYNIGDIVRTINNPVIALAFLERSYQKRFAFTMGKAEPDLGPNIWILEYKETERPTLIRGYGDGNLATHGRAWIDVETGHVVKTEFLIDDVMITARVTTTFKTDPRLQIHVPAEMVEEYKPSSGGRVSGRATYGRFRQFAVQTDEEIHKPDIPAPR